MFDETWLSREEPVVPTWDKKSYLCYGETNVGRIRDSNQDSFAINQDLGLFIVADGVGGHSGGELASQMAVQLVQEEIQVRRKDANARDTTLKQQILAQSVNTASLRIFERSLELPQYRGMATTLTLLWLPHADQKDSGDFGVVGHVGDSRCYLLRAGYLYQLTDDHSFINEQIKLGRLKASDPIVSQIRNVITRCVGNREEEEVDTRAVRLFKGDKFLICSDGLTTKIKDHELAALLSDEFPQEACQKLIALANERGGEDNITVSIVELT